MTTGTATGAPELSCYTTNLVGYLSRAGAAATRPGPAQRLAAAVRLAVRVDLPGGVLAFSHHDRVDRVDGWELAYRGAENWSVAQSSLRAELAEAGIVLAVGNSRHLHWSPHHRSADVPHWILLDDHDRGWWHLRDDFAAPHPRRDHRPYAGWLREEELHAALAPATRLAPELVLRDAHALGAPVPLPPTNHYRWLARQAVSPPQHLPGGWLQATSAVAFLADRLSADVDALLRHVDDLWAAARHHRHRLVTLAGTGGLRAPLGSAAAGAWTSLPRALRVAADSARRGRVRPALVERAFTELHTAMSSIVEEDR